MEDQRPPRVDADERTTILTLLQYQRESFARKVEGVNDVDGTTAIVPSGTTLLWLANHMADAERIWLLHRLQGANPADDPPHESTLAGALARYRSTWTVADGAIAASPDLGQRCRPFDDRPPVSLRWILVHLLEETARHAGHADILRELADGTTGR
jgi:uncharacterized damage-inducible protein DinB